MGVKKKNDPSGLFLVIKTIAFGISVDITPRLNVYATVAPRDFSNVLLQSEDTRRVHVPAGSECIARH